MTKLLKPFLILFLFSLLTFAPAHARATTIGEVIGWKFNHQPGMVTRNGVITEFPGGIPSQADQNTWIAEYLTRDIGAERIDSAFPQTDTARVIFEALFELTNRTITLEGGTAITRTQLRDWLKAKLP